MAAEMPRTMHRERGLRKVCAFSLSSTAPCWLATTRCITVVWSVLVKMKQTHVDEPMQNSTLWCSGICQNSPLSTSGRSIKNHRRGFAWPWQCMGSSRRPSRRWQPNRGGPWVHTRALACRNRCQILLRVALRARMYQQKVISCSSSKGSSSGSHSRNTSKSALRVAPCLCFCCVSLVGHSRRGATRTTTCCKQWCSIATPWRCHDARTHGPDCTNTFTVPQRRSNSALQHPHEVSGTRVVDVKGGFGYNFASSDSARSRPQNHHEQVRQATVSPGDGSPWKEGHPPRILVGCGLHRKSALAIAKPSWDDERSSFQQLGFCLLCTVLELPWPQTLST